MKIVEGLYEKQRKSRRYAFEGGLTNCLQIVGDCIEDGEELVEPGHGEDLADGIGGSGEGELGGLPACGLGEGEEGAQAHGA